MPNIDKLTPEQLKRIGLTRAQLREIIGPQSKPKLMKKARPMKKPKRTLKPTPTPTPKLMKKASPIKKPKLMKKPKRKL